MKKKYICIAFGILAMMGIAGIYYIDHQHEEDNDILSSVDIVVGEQTPDSNFALRTFALHVDEDAQDVTIADYQTSTKIDPPYRIESESKNVTLYLIDEMDVRFSSIQYTKNAKLYTKDFGRFHMRFQKGPTIEEYGFFSKKRGVLQGKIKQAPGKIIRIEAINPDLTLYADHIEEQSDGSTTFLLHYKYNKKYDILQSTLNYTINENGTEKKYYGSGNIVITKSGAGGNNVSATTAY